MLRWQNHKKKNRTAALESSSNQLHEQKINFCCIQPPRPQSLSPQHRLIILDHDRWSEINRIA